MNIKEIARQVQKAQSQAQKIQEDLAKETVEGTAGGGAVKVKLRCDYLVEAISIDPELLDPKEKEMVESLVAAGVTDAIKKVQTRTAEAMSKVMSGAMSGLPLSL